MFFTHSTNLSILLLQLFLQPVDLHFYIALEFVDANREIFLGHAAQDLCEGNFVPVHHHGQFLLFGLQHPLDHVALFQLGGLFLEFRYLRMELWQ